jgi:hypothetical protein
MVVASAARGGSGIRVLVATWFQARARSLRAWQVEVPGCSEVNAALARVRPMTTDGGNGRAARGASQSLQ